MRKKEPSKKVGEKEIVERLKKHFPNPRTELVFSNPFELLVVVVLSAQTTDVKVNQISPELFKRYPTPEAISKAPIEDLYKILKPINYYRKKAERIKEIGRIIAENYGGKVPDSIDELVKLPGVGRKTASVILVNAFNKPAIVVDTHVQRVSKRLGLTNSKDPLKIEKDLAGFFSEENWAYISNALVLFGRYICKAKNPGCRECHLVDICPYDKKNL